MEVVEVLEKYKTSKIIKKIEKNKLKTTLEEALMIGIKCNRNDLILYILNNKDVDLDYINDLSSRKAKNRKDIESLISQLLEDCKMFFIEYDSKKFKDIVEYVITNTELNNGDLKEVAKECARFFKDADIEKLKQNEKSYREEMEETYMNY